MNIQCDCGTWFNKTNNSQKRCPECKSLLDTEKEHEKYYKKVRRKSFRLHHPPIEVRDPNVAAPYWITRAQLNEYKPVFREMGVIWKEVG
jgi:hypothetical protein